MKVSFKTETCGQALVRAMKRNEEDAARIEALTEALRVCRASILRFPGSVHDEALAAIDAVLGAAPRSDNRKSDEFWSFTNGIGR